MTLHWIRWCCTEFDVESSYSMLIQWIRWYCIKFDDMLIMRVGTTFHPVLLLLYRIRCVFIQTDNVQIMRSLPTTIVCNKFTCYCCNILIGWDRDGIYAFSSIGCRRGWLWWINIEFDTTQSNSVLCHGIRWINIDFDTSHRYSVPPSPSLRPRSNFKAIPPEV
jgi:hypothetical protein